MKKWIMFLMVLLISSIFVACSSEETVTLEAEQDGLSTEITYKAEGDKVIEQSAENIMTYASMGVTTPEEAEEALAQFMEGYDNTEGITHHVDYQDDRVIESLTVDFEKADLTEVNQLQGTMFSGDIEEGISLKRSVEALEDQGYEIVE